MKTLLLILIICFNVIAVSDCYKGYATAVEKVDNIYKKAQYRHSLAFKDHYQYEIFPTTLFPFFCAPADTVKNLLSYEPVYLCDVTIGLHLDRNNQKHIQIAVLQYTTVGYSAPGIKFYTMYFFRLDPNTKGWIEDRDPLVVVFTLNKDGTYRAK
jgi:hypothetical protein